MGKASRARPVHQPAPARAPDTGYDAGGEVALLQAQIARRLALAAPQEHRPADGWDAERTVRRLSVAAGYAALVAGYAGLGAAVYFLI